jgi:hypothetical protein
MRVAYSTSAPLQTEVDSLPRLTLILGLGQQQASVAGLVDSGATVSVMPYEMGIQLGAVWDNSRANIQLGGNLGELTAMPLLVTGTVGDYPPVRLAFAWTRANNVPLILGQMNFFREFDICFYRSRFEFEVNPKAS